MPARSKKKSLVIVESPAKAKTINKYLGDAYTVLASYGHVRDLPHGRRAKGEAVVGINIDAGWVPRYVVQDKVEGKGRRSPKDIITELKKIASKSDMVYLATDPDREGEAIAWHLKEAMGLKDDEAQRVTFNEITKTAVKKAFESAGNIDLDRVAAQEARRFLDRLVGYKLSPLLRKKITSGLSAGRVQSVAVRLVVDREREIENFKTEEFWKITALVQDPPSSTSASRERKRPESTKPAVTTRIVKKKTATEQDPDAAEAAAPEGVASAEPEKLPEGAFHAELTDWKGEKFKSSTEADTLAIATVLEKEQYRVARIEQKDRTEKAPPPFTTSTLQQQSSIRLHFSGKKTMMLAQKLYEGIELTGEGPVALITYMRTDSTRISADALKACRDHIGKVHGKPYLPEKPNTFASGKSAQEAHEAIRPTDVDYTPEKLAKLLPAKLDFKPDLLRLYTLIYRRFVASQMSPAVFAITNVDIEAGAGLFKAQGKILKVDGYRKVLSPTAKQEDALLPALSEKQALDLLDLAASQHFTQPPPRFSEASLVKALEKEGIGRPSTYAPIIEKIKERRYVELKERRFFATETGKIVTDMLVQHFPKVLDVKFTSHMEEELDQIESRKIRRDDVLQEFWEPFRQDLEVAETKMEAVKGIQTGEVCPTCGKPLVIRYSKKTHRQFLGCSGWPECKYIKSESGEDAGPKETEIPCPECGKPMLERMGRRGPFLGCSGYPECKVTMNFDAEGKPVLASKPTEHVCDKCGKPMVLREGPRGQFLACTGYPKCRNAKDVDAEGNPVKPIETGVECVKCGAPMTVKRGPRGPFLGCSAYPKCRSTKPIPEELKEKVDKIFPPRAKKEVPAVEVTETCPECGAAMKLRPGRRGFFLGCSKYPKCKGTREAPPEVAATS